MEATLKKMDLAFCGSGKHKISVEKFLQSENAIFLDVRSKEEIETLKFNFNLFNIKVVHIPIEELPDRYTELSKDKLIGAFCSSGTRSAWAYIYLMSKGFEKSKWIAGGNEDFAAALKPGAIYKQTHRLNE